MWYGVKTHRVASIILRYTKKFLNEGDSDSMSRDYGLVRF